MAERRVPYEVAVSGTESILIQSFDVFGSKYFVKIDFCALTLAVAKSCRFVILQMISETTFNINEYNINELRR